LMKWVLSSKDSCRHPELFREERAGILNSAKAFPMTI
jgi:hypothetical protein